MGWTLLMLYVDMLTVWPQAMMDLWGLV